jgi:hypothetical protein
MFICGLSDLLSCGRFVGCYNEKDQEIDFDSVNRENVHNILNSPINEEEILRVVKNLKSNKASGYDDIVNEHIKRLLLTSDFFLSILFNIFQRPFGSVLDFSLIIFAVLS